MTPMPTLFLSHGSPRHAIESGWIGEAWSMLAARLGTPRAILVASAHWETSVPMLTGSHRPETVHDFGGFPRALYELRYPAPGDPVLAARAATLLRQQGLPAGVDPERGFDHGTWVPLLHLFPAANIPVVQISLQSHLSASHSIAVGKALAPLADEGVLIVGSGHMTHNLRDWYGSARLHGMRPNRTPPADYVREFTRWVDEALHAGGERLATWKEAAPNALRAHPSDEHFLPLPLAYAAAGPAPDVERIELGTDSAVLSMDSYLFTPRH